MYALTWTGWPSSSASRAAEVDERRPRSVQALEHQRRAIGERRQHLVVGRLVRDCGPGSSTPGERSCRSDRAVLRHAQERRPQPALGHQLVDCRGVDQVGEARRELSRAGQSRRTTPVPLGELPRRTGDTARQRRVACQRVNGHVWNRATTRRRRRDPRDRAPQGRRPRRLPCPRRRRRDLRDRAPQGRRPRRRPVSAPPSAGPSGPGSAGPSAPPSPVPVVMSSSSSI